MAPPGLARSTPGFLAKIGTPWQDPGACLGTLHGNTIRSKASTKALISQVSEIPGLSPSPGRPAGPPASIAPGVPRRAAAGRLRCAICHGHPSMVSVGDRLHNVLLSGPDRSRERRSGFDEIRTELDPMQVSAHAINTR